jgi:NADH-quinone oxidoreductase subunit C
MEAGAETEKIRQLFGESIIDVFVKNERRLVISIMPDSLTDIAEFLFLKEGYRFIIATALQSKQGYEIYYHFSKDDSGTILNLHVVLDKTSPRIESLSNLFNASNWIEREMHELFGIDFINHPNQEKLLSEGNWAEGVYPMRKEFNETRKS